MHDTAHQFPALSELRRPLTQADLDCIDRPLPGLSPREALRLRGKSEAAGVVAVLIFFGAVCAVFGGL